MMLARGPTVQSVPTNCIDNLSHSAHSLLNPLPIELYYRKTTERMPERMGELLTATEAARRYSISERTIRTWVKVGKLPAKKIKIDGLDSWQIDTDEIEKAIAQKKAGKLNSGMLPEVIARMEALELRIAMLEEKIEALTRPNQQERPLPIVEPETAHTPPKQQASPVAEALRSLASKQQKEPPKKK